MARDQRAIAPVDVGRANWTPLGPLAVPNGQTYGGARVLISGRVTAIAPHPTDGNTIFIGTSRGGVWRTVDGAETWTPIGDDQPSLAIGALGIGTSDPNVLYAGTGEGNVQYYSTAFALNSAPGVYLGVGVLRSTDGGASWTLHGSSLLANHSFYRIAVDRVNANRAFAATSRGLCRTTDGVTWNALTGNGLPAISGSVIACTDVLIDRSDNTGNTVYAAFWGSGIYKSTNALAASPAFTLLTTGLPAGTTTSRISLTQSASSPERKYALVASSGDAFLGLYRTTTAAGTTWELCTNSATVQLYGAFTSDVNVDPTTPDVVYVSGVELYKCVRSTATGAWSASNIGNNIHPDSHCLAFHPTLNQTIYSGNDGGFYVSRDGGTSWEDAANEGLCLLQYEAIDNHPSTDAFVQGGTQDNGTQQFRNSPVHFHSADGDGGYCTYVPDRAYLYPKLTAREFLEFVGHLYGLDAGQVERVSIPLLERFDLAEWIDELIESYSHGMRQKLAVTAALIHDPEVVVIDEPMVGLDPRSARVMKSLLADLVDTGKTVFLSTHTLQVAEELCSRVAIVQKGLVVARGTLDELRRVAMTDHGSLEAVFLRLTQDDEPVAVDELRERRARKAAH